MTPSPLDIVAARRRLRGRIRPTPLHDSAWLSSEAGGRVWLKAESLQLTGSFKIRGALNALMQLPPGTHVATASAGNHGRAIAYAAEALGLTATVFTPRDAPETKIAAIRRHGADLRQEAPNYDEAEIQAKRWARENGATFVSPYNHPDVIAGAGTVAFEILEETPRIDTIVVPIGGGGLISGIAIAAKALSPAIRVVGVESEASNAFQVSLRHGKITTIDPGATIADGLGGNMDPDTITFDIIKRYVDDVVVVSEGDLFDAIRGLVREDHFIAEGAGAAATAAVLAGKVKGERLAVLLSGSNIDARRLAAVLSEAGTRG